MKKSNELSLKEAIQHFLKAHELDEKLLEKEIYARWEELAGKSVNDKTKQIKLNDGVLTVYLLSSTLRKELSMRKTALITHLNHRLKGEPVKDVVFR